MNLKVLVIAICFLSASVFADSDMKSKDISTVDDVKELRALMIKRMNTKLASGDLDERRVKFLEKRIALLETKPLPTQEQLNFFDTFGYLLVRQLFSPEDTEKIIEGFE